MGEYFEKQLNKKIERNILDIDENMLFIIIASYDEAYKLYSKLENYSNDTLKCLEKGADLTTRFSLIFKNLKIEKIKNAINIESAIKKYEDLIYNNINNKFIKYSIKRLITKLLLI